VNYQLADGTQSPFAATLVTHLQDWLEDDPEVQTMVQTLPAIDRNIILNRN
jgi:ArsR family transcriptional regulator